MTSLKTAHWIAAVIGTVGVGSLLIAGLAADEWGTGVGALGAALTAVATLYAVFSALIARDAASDAVVTARRAHAALVVTARPAIRLIADWSKVAPGTGQPYMSDMDLRVLVAVEGDGDYANVRARWAMQGQPMGEFRALSQVEPGRYLVPVEGLQVYAPQHMDIGEIPPPGQNLAAVEVQVLERQADAEWLGLWPVPGSYPHLLPMWDFPMPVQLI